jgi:hypothetical protein
MFFMPLILSGVGILGSAALELIDANHNMNVGRIFLVMGYSIIYYPVYVMLIVIPSIFVLRRLQIREHVYVYIASLPLFIPLVLYIISAEHREHGLFDFITDNVMLVGYMNISITFLHYFLFKRPKLNKNNF